MKITVDKIVKKNFFKVNRKPKDDWTAGQHNPLCTVFDDNVYYYDWLCFWKKINTKKWTYVYQYFKTPSDNFEDALLRLLVVEEFKKELGQ